MLTSKQQVVALLSIISLMIVTLRAANALSLFGSSPERDRSESEKLAQEQMASQENNLRQQQQQQQQQSPQASVSMSAGLQGQQSMDPASMQQLIEFGLNPMASSAKYLLPNTYQGLTNDLTNGYSMLSNGAQKGYTQFSSMIPSAMSMFNPESVYRNRYTEMLQQRLMQSEEMLRQMYELTSNPEQLCRQFLQQTKNGLEQANQAIGAQQQGMSASTAALMNKLGGSGSFSFG